MTMDDPFSENGGMTQKILLVHVEGKDEKPDANTVRVASNKTNRRNLAPKKVGGGQTPIRTPPSRPSNNYALPTPPSSTLVSHKFGAHRRLHPQSLVETPTKLPQSIAEAQNHLKTCDASGRVEKDTKEEIKSMIMFGVGEVSSTRIEFTFDGMSQVAGLRSSVDENPEPIIPANRLPKESVAKFINCLLAKLHFRHIMLVCGGGCHRLRKGTQGYTKVRASTR